MKLQLSNKIGNFNPPKYEKLGNFNPPNITEDFKPLQYHPWWRIKVWEKIRTTRKTAKPNLRVHSGSAEVLNI